MKTTELIQANRQIEQQNALLTISCTILSKHNKRLYKQCKIKIRCSLYNKLISIEHAYKSVKHTIKLVQNKAMSIFLTKEKVRTETAISETDTRKYSKVSIS